MLALISLLFVNSAASDTLLGLSPAPVDKLPYLCCLGMVLLSFLSNVPVVLYIAAFSNAGYDNSHPRKSQAMFLNEKHHPIAFRLKSAHLNTSENIPVLATCVFIATALKLETVLLAKLSLFYMLCRIAYVLAYLLNLDMVRTLLFIVSLTSCVLMASIPIFPESNILALLEGLLAQLPMKLEL